MGNTVVWIIMFLVTQQHISTLKILYTCLPQSQFPYGSLAPDFFCVEDSCWSLDHFNKFDFTWLMLKTEVRNKKCLAISAPWKLTEFLVPQMFCQKRSLQFQFQCEWKLHMCHPPPSQEMLSTFFYITPSPHFFLFCSVPKFIQN